MPFYSGGLQKHETISKKGTLIFTGLATCRECGAKGSTQFSFFRVLRCSWTFWRGAVDFLEGGGVKGPG